MMIKKFNDFIKESANIEYKDSNCENIIEYLRREYWGYDNVTPNRDLFNKADINVRISFIYKILSNYIKNLSIYYRSSLNDDNLNSDDIDKIEHIIISNNLYFTIYLTKLDNEYFSLYIKYSYDEYYIKVDTINYKDVIKYILPRIGITIKESNNFILENTSNNIIIYENSELFVKDIISDMNIVFDKLMLYHTLYIFNKIKNIISSEVNLKFKNNKGLEVKDSNNDISVAIISNNNFKLAIYISESRYIYCILESDIEESDIFFKVDSINYKDIIKYVLHRIGITIKESNIIKYDNGSQYLSDIENNINLEINDKFRMKKIFNSIKYLFKDLEIFFRDNNEKKAHNNEDSKNTTNCVLYSKSLSFNVVITKNSYNFYNFLIMFNMKHYFFKVEESEYKDVIKHIVNIINSEKV